MPQEPEQTLVSVGAWKASAWFLQNSLDAYVAVRHGVLAWANETWTTLTGWSAAASIGRPYADFLFREDAAGLTDEIERLSQNGARTVITKRIASKSRGAVWLRHHVVRGEDGWVLMILRDITAERQREADAEQARRVAALVRATAGVTPWRYDAEDDYYEIDPDFTEPADERRAGQPGASQREIIHPDDRAAVALVWHRTLTTGEPGEVEYRMRRGRQRRWRRVRGAWQGLRQRPSGRWDVLGVVADITEIADARDAALRGERAAKSAAEAKSRFLANISHEIRTPMNGVLGVLHLLKSDPPQAERVRLADKALACGVGLSDLLNDIIDFADVESGLLELAPEPTSPAEQLESIVAMHRPLVEAKGVELTVSTASGLGWVAADPARLRKLFFHLVSNAVKFTHAGRIEARLGASGDGEARRLRLEVEDTGVGIAREAQGQVFTQFTQADSSVTRRYGGPGLGLALTRQLAEAMGGGVGFTSTPGKGSTFWVEVAAPAAAVLANDPGEASPWLEGVRVLVVEDNAVNRLVATHMLGQLGARVVTAENGAEGVAAMEAGDFDLVFMDIQMPVMDGVEASRRIRAMAAPKGQVPIVATTANVMPDQVATYRASGIDGVVAKPISPAALLSEVARLAAA